MAGEDEKEKAEKLAVAKKRVGVLSSSHLASVLTTISSSN